MIVPFWLEIDERNRARAEHALDQLLCGPGHVGCRVQEPADAVILYAEQRPDTMRPGACWIRATPAADWDSDALWSRIAPIVTDVCRTGDVDVSNGLADVLIATYAIQQGALERGLPRDRIGVPRFAEADDERLVLLSRPLIAELASRLEAVVSTMHPAFALERLPRWPAGKRYAVVITHDVDAPFSRPGAPFMIRRARRSFGAGDGLRGARELLAAGKSAAIQALGKMPAPEVDPNLCFERWREVESRLTSRSCHFVAVTTSADRGAAPEDVMYDFRHPVVRREIAALLDAGWEIGLHASINARTSASRIADERAKLEKVLHGASIAGVRHHWWSLDADRPERTFRAHADAALRYDSSLGANDAVVFRRGMAWPYHPFDRDHNHPVSVMQLPPTLMDGAIFYHEEAARSGDERIAAHVRQVAGVEGMVMLDWHLEQLNPARLRGAGPALVRALSALPDPSEIFWALPRDIEEWWRGREQRRRAATGLLSPLTRVSRG